MSGPPWALAFAGPRVLLRCVGEEISIPTDLELEALLGADEVARAEVHVALPSPLGRTTRAFDLPDEFEPSPGYRLEGLRAAYHALPEELFRAAGAARQKIDWVRTHGFCSKCGAPTRRHHRAEAMKCTACGQLHFPRIAPAMIVLVQKDREMLLGRSAHFTNGVYSTLAGFVEPGESLEECVHREIEEEVGVLVTNIRYFGSQPHPFPHSLMVGFVADWGSGDIRIDPGEIEDARWFTADDLPELPHPMSIARRLIDDFLDRTSS